MDYSIKKEPVCITQTIFDGTKEQPVDLDFNLPDYCPDIARILKCQIYPSISSKSISGDMLNIEGNANILLIYLDEEKMSIRSCEHLSPFSVSFNLKSTPQDAIIFTSTKVEYVNCRAVNSRRLDIHGAFSVFAKVKAKKEQDIVNSISGDGIEQKKSDINIFSTIGLGQQQFTINEEITKSKKQPDIELILKTEVTTSLVDYKTIDNKIIINAQAILKVLYISDIEYGSIDSMEYDIPISQIVDIDGITDDCMCDINIEALGHDVQLRQDEQDGINIIEFEGKFMASAIAYEEKAVETLNDLYSIDYEIEPKYENIKILSEIENIKNSYENKSILDIFNNGINEVIDVSCEINSINSYIEEDKLISVGKLNICILAKDDEEIPFYSERVVDFEYQQEYPSDENVSCSVKAFIKSLDWKVISNSSMEVTVGIQMDTIINKVKNIKSIIDIYVDEENIKEKNDDAVLTIYYADEGEEIWDIARKYCTSVEKIKTENEIDEDIISERGMIFIPM